MYLKGCGFISGGEDGKISLAELKNIRQAFGLGARTPRFNQICAGAVLDMFEKLPNPITNPFRRLSNVVVLPGVAAISREVNERLKAHMYRNLCACLNGEPIQNVINKKV